MLGPVWEAEVLLENSTTVLLYKLKPAWTNMEFMLAYAWFSSRAGGGLQSKNI